MNIQQQSRVGSTLSMLAVTASVSVTQTRTAVYAGFMLGSRLPAPHNPGNTAGFISGFVAYRATVTTVSIHASYRFSVSSQARPQAKDPARALFERTREHPAGAMLFGQTATYQVTTVSMLYFTYVCMQASARSKGMAPPPKPMPMQTPKQLAAGNAPAAPAAPSFNPVPQAANVPAPASVPASSAPATERPGATVSLKPVEPSGKSDPSKWEDLPGFNPKRARFELWDMEQKNKWRPVALSLADSPTTERKVTPQQLARDGLSFTAVNENNTVESIPLDKVNSFNVLNA
ncbi:hypothetical protein [Variovorax sp. DT-64]|uniref:hypothetical protein n=1 Tax=Variovorax sp. DT-64 TaxID=3396160 RepID=UPI003F1C61EC